MVTLYTTHCPKCNVLEKKLDKKKIELKEPIKTLGVYKVTAKVYPEITATFSVDVLPLLD